MPTKTHALADALQIVQRRDATDVARNVARVTLYQNVRRDLLPRCRQLLDRHASPTARDADDLISDALVATLFAGSPARCLAGTDAAVIAYLQQTITRDWLDERRRDSEQSEGPFVDADAARCVDGLYTTVPYPCERRRAFHHAYTAALADVPAAFRETWVLVVHEGHTTESAGNTLGVARSTVSNRCAKVRRHLQPFLVAFLPEKRAYSPLERASRRADAAPSPIHERVEGTLMRL